MKKTFLHRTLALLMAFILLVTTTGVSMDVHYCQNQLKGISLIGEAKTCHEKKAKNACHHAKKDAAKDQKKNDCCHNETIVVEKSDLDATSPQFSTFENLEIDQVHSLAGTYLLGHFTHSSLIPYRLYKPPLPDKDLGLLYQNFLI